MELVIRRLIAASLIAQALFLSSCSKSTKIATAELQRADGTKVLLSLWATPSPWWKFTDTPTYYVEFHGRMHQFAGGGFESSYASVVQSPDRQRAVVMCAFRGAPRGVIELDLKAETIHYLGGSLSFLNDYERDGWSIHHWVKLGEPTSRQREP